MLILKKGLVFCATLVAAAIISFGFGGRARSESSGLSWQDTNKLLSLNSVWVSRGYGIVWQIQNGRSREYEISGQYCIFVEEEPGPPDSAAPRMLLDPKKSILRVGVADGIGYLHIFDRRNSLPAPCRKRPDASPAGVFNAVDQIFTHRYAFFEKRKIDWRSRVRDFRPRLSSVKTDEALFDLLEALLMPIGDEHISLRGYVDGENRYFSPDRKLIAKPARLPATSRLPGIWSSAAANRLLGPRAKQNASGSIVYGMLDKEIGYLGIRSFWWRRVRDLGPTLDKALDLFQRAKIVIVDVSSNGGGSERFAKRVAERFAKKPTIGLFKYAGDAKGAKPQPIHLIPSRGKRFLGPTYVISNAETFSAAETLVLYMGALENVTHIGRPTGGALSDVLTRKLPNGWRLGLSNEVYLDAKGRAWEGIGIPPKIELKVESDEKRFTVRDLTAARQALAAIRAHAIKALPKD